MKSQCLSMFKILLIKGKPLALFPSTNQESVVMASFMISTASREFTVLYSKRY